MSRSRLVPALALALVLEAATLFGCSFGEIYLDDPLLREVALGEQQKRYSSLVRWSAFHKAAKYVQPDARDAFLALAPPLKEFRFTDYESTPVEVDESGECTVEVTYYGYRLDTLYEVTVRETQHWKRNDFTNTWHVTPEFHDLGEVASGQASLH